MIYIFFLQFLRHSDVTKWDTVFSHESKSLYVEVLYTPTIIVFLLFVASMWLENVNRNTKMKKKKDLIIFFFMYFNFT